jgi:hypothetical protein
MGLATIGIVILALTLYRTMFKGRSTKLGLS